MRWAITFFASVDGYTPQSPTEIEADYWESRDDGFLYFHKAQDPSPSPCDAQVVAAVAKGAVKAVELVEEAR